MSVADKVRRKITCSSCAEHGDRSPRWLASAIEGGLLKIYCPRCRGYHEEPLVNFLTDLIEELEGVETEARRQGLGGTGKLKVFG